MDRWHLTLGLALLTLGAAALAPRLLPSLADGSRIADVEVPVVAEPPAVVDVIEPAVPRQIDVVLAIDTSGSMDDLIDSVRARLWDIVNTIDAEDPEATLRVGLLAFGSPAYGEENAYVTIVSPLTDDLDALYTSVFALDTTGGDEFVGSTIQVAMSGLDWAPTQQPDDRRLLFVAGNEGATQGPIDPFAMAQEAHANGIVVSTLFAGDHVAGVQSGWQTVAQHGGGKYLAIDMEDSARAVAATPYDQRIQELNRALNGTYVAYGEAGADKLAELKDNDARAQRMGVGALAGRAAAKGGKKFKTASWDLVEAVEADASVLDRLSGAQLPAELQGLSKADQKVEVQKMATKRKATKAQLKQLAEQRRAHLQAGPQEEGLDKKMAEAMADLL
jgi:hypothetical protein